MATRRGFISAFLAIPAAGTLTRADTQPRMHVSNAAVVTMTASDIRKGSLRTYHEQHRAPICDYERLVKEGQTLTKIGDRIIVTVLDEPFHGVVVRADTEYPGHGTIRLQRVSLHGVS